MGRETVPFLLFSPSFDDLALIARGPFYSRRIAGE